MKTKSDTAFTLTILAASYAAVTYFAAEYYESILSGASKTLLLFLFIKIILVFVLISFYTIKSKNKIQKSLEHSSELLRISEQRYKIIEEYSDNIHFEANLKEDSIYFNSNFESVFGQKPGISKLSDWTNLLSFISLEDLQLVINAWNQLLEQGQQASCEIRIIDADGRMLWHRLTLAAQFNPSGEVFRVLGRLANIDAQVRQMRRLKFKSMLDPLTRLYHRTASETMVDDFLKDEGVSGRHAMLIIALDNLTEISESFGRLAGDNVLLRTSKILKRIFRDSDIVGRLGGDEFMVFLKDLSEEYLLEIKIRELITALSNLKLEGRKDFFLECSVGSAIYSIDGNNFIELYTTAYGSLNNKKISEKSSITFFSIKEQQKI